MTTTAAAAAATVVAVLAATLLILHYCACPLARIEVAAVTSVKAEAVAFRMGQKSSAAIVIAERVRFCMT